MAHARDARAALSADTAVGGEGMRAQAAGASHLMAPPGGSFQSSSGGGGDVVTRGGTTSTHGTADLDDLFLPRCSVGQPDEPENRTFIQLVGAQRVDSPVPDSQDDGSSRRSSMRADTQDLMPPPPAPTANPSLVSGWQPSAPAGGETNIGGVSPPFRPEQVTSDSDAPPGTDATMPSEPPRAPQSAMSDLPLPPRGRSGGTDSEEPAAKQPSTASHRGSRASAGASSADVRRAATGVSMVSSNNGRDGDDDDGMDDFDLGEGVIAGYRLRRIFDRLDVHNRGAVGRAQILKALRADAEVRALLRLPAHIRQASPAHTDFERLFQALDRDNDRQITWPEFRNTYFACTMSNFRPKNAPNFPYNQMSFRAGASAVFRAADEDERVKQQQQQRGGKQPQTTTAAAAADTTAPNRPAATTATTRRRSSSTSKTGRRRAGSSRTSSRVSSKASSASSAGGKAKAAAGPQPQQPQAVDATAGVPVVMSRESYRQAKEILERSAALEEQSTELLRQSSAAGRARKGSAPAAADPTGGVANATFATQSDVNSSLSLTVRQMTVQSVSHTSATIPQPVVPISTGAVAQPVTADAVAAPTGAPMDVVRVPSSQQAQVVVPAQAPVPTPAAAAVAALPAPAPQQQVIYIPPGQVAVVQDGRLVTVPACATPPQPHALERAASAVSVGQVAYVTQQPVVQPPPPPQQQVVVTAAPAPVASPSQPQVLAAPATPQQGTVAYVQQGQVVVATPTHGALEPVAAGSTTGSVLVASTNAAGQVTLVPHASGGHVLVAPPQPHDSVSRATSEAPVPAPPPPQPVAITSSPALQDAPRVVAVVPSATTAPPTQQQQLVMTPQGQVVVAAETPQRVVLVRQSSEAAVAAPAPPREAHGQVVVAQLPPPSVDGAVVAAPASLPQRIPPGPSDDAAVVVAAPREVGEMPPQPAQTVPEPTPADDTTATDTATSRSSSADDAAGGGADPASQPTYIFAGHLCNAVKARDAPAVVEQVSAIRDAARWEEVVGFFKCMYPGFYEGDVRAAVRGELGDEGWGEVVAVLRDAGVFSAEEEERGADAAAGADDAAAGPLEPEVAASSAADASSTASESHDDAVAGEPYIIAGRICGALKTRNAAGVQRQLEGVRDAAHWREVVEFFRVSYQAFHGGDIMDAMRGELDAGAWGDIAGVLKRWTPVAGGTTEAAHALPTPTGASAGRPRGEPYSGRLHRHMSVTGTLASCNRILADTEELLAVSSPQRDRGAVASGDAAARAARPRSASDVLGRTNAVLAATQQLLHGGAAAEAVPTSRPAPQPQPRVEVRAHAPPQRHLPRDAGALETYLEKAFGLNVFTRANEILNDTSRLLAGPGEPGSPSPRRQPHPRDEDDASLVSDADADDDDVASAVGAADVAAEITAAAAAAAAEVNPPRQLTPIEEQPQQQVQVQVQHEPGREVDPLADRRAASSSPLRRRLLSPQPPEVAPHGGMQVQQVQIPPPPAKQLTNNTVSSTSLEVPAQRVNSAPAPPPQLCQYVSGVSFVNSEVLNGGGGGVPRGRDSAVASTATPQRRNGSKHSLSRPPQRYTSGLSPHGAAGARPPALRELSPGRASGYDHQPAAAQQPQASRPQGTLHEPRSQPRGMRAPAPSLAAAREGDTERRADESIADWISRLERTSYPGAVTSYASRASARGAAPAAMGPNPVGSGPGPGGHDSALGRAGTVVTTPPTSAKSRSLSRRSATRNAMLRSFSSGGASSAAGGRSVVREAAT